MAHAFPVVAKDKEEGATDHPPPVVHRIIHGDKHKEVGGDKYENGVQEIRDIPRSENLWRFEQVRS